MSSSSPSHTLRSFDTALRENRANIIAMASLARQNLERAVRGLLERNPELCGDVIDDDEEVDEMERIINRESFAILMRYIPVASDLREVLAGLKVASNLERVSDQAEVIAKRARKILKVPEVPETRVIQPLYEAAIGMLDEAIRSFTEGDAEACLDLARRDHELDKDHRQAIREITAALERDPSSAKTCLHLIFIVRCLERVGDHALNIAEETVFAVKSVDVRHLPPDAAAREHE